MEIFQIIKGSIGKTLEIVVIQGPEISDTLHNILRVGMGGDGGNTVYDRYMIEMYPFDIFEEKKDSGEWEEGGEGKVFGFW